MKHADVRPKPVLSHWLSPADPRNGSEDKAALQLSGGTHAEQVPTP
jgi:hypothetical protein